MIQGGEVRTKPPILNETKQPILKTRQNSRFWKRDKTADFENETKPPILNETRQPILKRRQNSRFWKRDKIAKFRNGTKRPISKKRQNRRFWIGTKQPIFVSKKPSIFLLLVIKFQLTKLEDWNDWRQTSSI